MGSLNNDNAKEQFLTLIENVSCLPSFTIWLDSKLAEYKTNGEMKRDSELVKGQLYPPWIAKSLRANLSFMFADHEAPTTSHSGNDNAASSSTNNDTICPTQKRQSSKLTIEDVVVSMSKQREASVARQCENSAESYGDGVSVKCEAEAFEVEDIEDGQAVESLTRTTEQVEYLSQGSVEYAQPLEAGVEDQDLDGSLDNDDMFPVPNNESHDVFVPVSSFVLKEDKQEQHLKRTFGNESAASTLGPVQKRSNMQWLTENRIKAGRSIFSCPYCPKVFPYKVYFDRHIVVHTKQKPYNCPYCTKSFTRPSICFDHQKKLHPEKPPMKVRPGSNV